MTKHLITTLIDDWKIRSADAKHRLRLKWLPHFIDPSDTEEARHFLSMTDAEQTSVIQSVDDMKADEYIELLTARALYRPPVDRGPGAIREAKVAAHQERYR